MPKKRLPKKTGSPARTADSLRSRGDIIIQLPGDSSEPPPTFLEDYPDHARLIGCIISEWSHIEHKLALLLSFELGANWKAIRPMLYAIESSSARLEVIRAAFMTLLADDAPRRETMYSLIDRARALLTQRNKYAHSLYGFSRQGGIAIISMTKGTANDLPLHDLTYQFEQMKELSHRVGQMLGFPTPQELRARLFGVAAPPSSEPDSDGPPTRP